MGDIDFGTKIAQWLKETLIDPLYNFITSFGDNGQWWMEIIILAIAAILLVCGLIFLIVKSWKILLVLFVLAGIGLIVYFVVIKKDIVPETESIASSFRTANSLLKAFL